MKLRAGHLEPIRTYDPWRARQYTTSLTDAQFRLLRAIANACQTGGDDIAIPASCGYPSWAAIERLVVAGVVECVWFDHGALRGLRMTVAGLHEIGGRS